MPMPLYNTAIGKVIQPRPYEEALNQQINRVENKRTEAPQKTESVKPQETEYYPDRPTVVTFVRNSVELDKLLSGEKGILLDTHI